MPEFLRPIETVTRVTFISQRQRLKTKGDEWYHLPATRITPEIRRDLRLLQMRSALNPKRFYKKNDRKELPKYFQVIY